MILRSDRYDTTPGAAGECAVLAPPASFTGDAEAYTEWLRGRYVDDPLIRQVMAIQAMFGDSPRRIEAVFEGPFADALETAIVRLRGTLRSGPKTSAAPARDRTEREIYEDLSELQCVDDPIDVAEPLVLV
jgi:hypothetical protein